MTEDWECEGKDSVTSSLFVLPVSSCGMKSGVVLSSSGFVGGAGGSSNWTKGLYSSII